MEDGHDIVAELLVAVEVATDEKEVAAELTGTPTWHTTTDAVAPGFIRSGQHHTSAYGDGPVPQRRIQELLNRRVEGIEVGVQDCRPPDWRRFHRWQISRTCVRLPGGAPSSPGGFAESPAVCRLKGHLSSCERDGGCGSGFGNDRRQWLSRSGLLQAIAGADGPSVRRRASTPLATAGPGRGPAGSFELAGRVRARPDGGAELEQ